MTLAQLTLAQLNVECVTFETFTKVLQGARDASADIAKATSPVAELSLDDGGFCVLSADRKAGFIVKGDGELTSLFSLERGRGDYLAVSAVLLGATHLDCFDGYLTKFYRKHGFVSYKIVPNWTEGEPSVHFMRLFESKAA